jgi:hypothetical protein
LPDGLFSNPKARFGKILEGFGMEWFGTFFGHFEYITAIWYNLWPFGTIYGHLVQFMAIWYNLWPFGTIYGHLVQFMAIW